jgi:hypothetical protein
MTIVRAEQFDVDQRLAELGLQRSELRRILEQAQAARRSCTELDPITLPGNLFWGRVIRHARELYRLQGWVPARPKLIELVVHPSGTFGFTACSGDRNTGNPDPEVIPASRYSKGTAMRDRVHYNQMVIPGMEVQPPPPDDDTYAGIPMWCLLYYHEAIKEDGIEKTRLWSEFSLPERVGERGRIDKWIERLVLDPIDFDEALVLPEPDEGDVPGTDIDVPIERMS